MAEEEQDGFSLDWRVAFGLGVTLTWITAGITYLFTIVGLENFVYLPTADIGSFLEGAFAPLAFLWLVVGHFMQQKEITANTKAVLERAESEAIMPRQAAEALARERVEAAMRFRRWSER